MKIIVKNNYREMSEEAFKLFKSSLRDAEVLGFATGSTPKLLYEMLSAQCLAGKISFKGKLSFNLDEYYPIKSTDPDSYRTYMENNLFKNIDLDRIRINFPDSELDADVAVRQYAAAYRSAGPIDLQILGIGRNGHIGFNEPGSGRESRIRLVTLSEDTIARNGTSLHQAITMGVKEILESRKIMLLASGEDKSDAIAKVVWGRVTETVPASFLKDHPDTVLIIDKGAASGL